MLKNVVYVAVFVSDQDKALDFYTNVVGLEKIFENAPTPEGPRFLTVGVKAQDFALVLWPGTPGRGKPTQGTSVAQYTIETDDCRKSFEALTARGVKFDPPEVLERPWGLVAKFEDPDGNVLQFREARRAS